MVPAPKDKKAPEETLFKLKFKGAIPNLKEAPKDPTLGFMNEDALAMARRRSSFGVKRADEIGDSLQERISEGNSVTHQVKSSSKDKEVEEVFALRISGGQPTLSPSPSNSKEEFVLKQE